VDVLTEISFIGMTASRSLHLHTWVRGLSWTHSPTIYELNASAFLSLLYVSTKCNI